MHEDDNLLPENTVCKKCRHWFVRTIRPEVPEEYLSSDDLESIDIDSCDGEDNEIVVIQSICLITNDDIVDAVLSCSHFDSKKDFFKKF
jgi:hypothetical protein